MKRFVITLVVATMLGLGSLFPMARPAAAESPWYTYYQQCTTNSGDFGYWYYNANSDRMRCVRA